MRRLLLPLVAPLLTPLLTLVGLAVLAAVVASPWELPVLRQALVVVLLGVPVLALVRRGSLATKPLQAFLVAVGLVMAGAILLALLINTVLPPLGFAHPLARAPVTITYAVATALLLLWRASVPLVRAQELRAVAGGLLRMRFEPATTVAVLSVVFAVAGAIRLNNQSSSWLPAAGHTLVVVSLAILLVRRERRGRDAVVLYLAAVSLLLSMSLRGWYIIGHDIKIEYLAYTLTAHGDHWVMAELPSAYNACLSINIWPTVLANLTGLPGMWVFKVVFQLIFAITPIIVYCTTRGVVRRRTAVVAAVFFMAFPTFFNDMPYLNRQETAFVFLGLALMVAYAGGGGVWRRRLLCIVLGVGVVVSHYSTTYVLLMGLGIAMVLAGLGRWRTRRRLRRGADPATVTAWQPLTLASPVILAIVAGATVLWVGPATQSGGHLAETVRVTAKQLLTGNSDAASSDLGYGLLARKSVSPQQRLQQYVDGVVRARDREKGQPWVIDPPTRETLHPKSLDIPKLPLTVTGRALERAGVDANSLNSMTRLVCAGAIQVWLLLGLVVALVRWRRNAGPGTEMLALMIGSMGGVGLLVLVPSLTADYGVLRAFEQAMLAAAPAVAIGATYMFGVLTRPLRGMRWRLAEDLAGIAGLVVLLVLSGVVVSLTGGYPGVLSVANSGQYYDLYWRDEPQVRAGEWIGPAAQAEGHREGRGIAVAGDDAVSLLQLTGGRVAVRSGFYPLELKQGEWVYLSGPNVTKSQASVFYTGDLLSYRYPVEELRRRMDVVYSAPGAEVLR